MFGRFRSTSLRTGSSTPLRFAQDNGFGVGGSSVAERLIAFAEVDYGLDLGVEEFLGLLDHGVFEGFGLD
jgi:hypothetical protein